MNRETCGGLILIAEDNKKTSSLLSLYLEREGFQTILAYEGRQALALAQQHNLIFVILDVSLPVINGWEICRELRRASDVPILILTARGEAHERVMGLKLGADDYVVKPFSLAEVVIRVKTILRRVRPSATDMKETYAKELLSYDGLVLDVEKRKATVHAHTVSLTPSEYKLLHVLMAAPGRVFLREELLDHLYPNGEAVVDRVIDVHIANLRQKIEADASKPQYILTARGFGYQFADSQRELEAERGLEGRASLLSLRQPPRWTNRKRATQ